ncbi:MAG TPA: signal peptidase I [Microscillaceae bacterium]|nr:signal peptidase I [Microscillaceae bacterium]
MSVPPPTPNPDSDQDLVVVPKRRSRKKRSGFGSWLRTLFVALILSIILKLFFLEAFIIPSDSMAGTLQNGDFILVNKLHYGPRTPQTILQIPLTHQSMPGLKKTYSDLIKLPVRRLPGYSRIKRGDVLVFNFPPDSKHPLSQKTHYIKRCVALAGDTVKIVDTEVFINEKKQDTTGFNLTFQYEVGGKSPQKESVLKNANIPFQVNGDAYRFWASPVQAAKLSKDKRLVPDPSKKPLLSVSNNGVRNPHVYPQSDRLPWNEDFYGPMVVPKKGMVMSMVRFPDNVALYSELIRKYESPKSKVEVINNQLIIDGVLVERYTFKNDYYFVMGDSRHNSSDSRYWGLVPGNHIVGKAAMILFSTNKDQSWLNISKFRKKRWFKKIK